MEGFTVRRCRAYPRRRDYYFAPDIYRLILRGHYDLVHCQGIHTAVPVLAMLAARRRGVPYVVTLHTGGHSSAFRRRSRGTQWRILAPLVRRAAAIVAVSRFEQRVFQEACRVEASRFTVIPNGGNLPAGADRPASVPGRIVSAGRLERYKGHQRVVEALPIVKQTIPHATLRIYGAGPYEQQLRASIGSLGVAQSAEIQYIAPDNRARIAEALCEAEVFAALSEYEAHPVAVMEALTLGIPTVGLDTAGLADLVSDGLVTGIPKDSVTHGRRAGPGGGAGRRRECLRGAGRGRQECPCGAAHLGRCGGGAGAYLHRCGRGRVQDGQLARCTVGSWSGSSARATAPGWRPVATARTPAMAAAARHPGGGDERTDTLGSAAGSFLTRFLAAAWHSSSTRQ